MGTAYDYSIWGCLRVSSDSTLIPPKTLLSATSFPNEGLVLHPEVSCLDGINSVQANAIARVPADQSCYRIYSTSLIDEVEARVSVLLLYAGLCKRWRLTTMHLPVVAVLLSSETVIH